VVFERVRVSRLGGRDVGGCACGLAQLVEQARLDGPRIEDGLQTAGGELLDLLRRQVDAVALRDARLYVADDLIDVGLIGLALLASLRRRGRAAVSPPVVTAPAAMEVRPPSLMRMLICCHVNR
jgi:hypothetical protein